MCYVNLEENQELHMMHKTCSLFLNIIFYIMKLTVSKESVSEVECSYEAGEGVIGGASFDLSLDGGQLHFCQFSFQTSVGLLELHQ